MHAEVVIRHPEQPERTVRLEPGVTRVGRAEDNEIVLSDVGVSRHHAQLVCEGGLLRIEDLGSGNGTWRGGQRVHEHVLADGDEVAIDPFVLTFRVRRAARSEPPRGGVVARLELLAEGGQVVGVFPVRGEPLTVGRSEERDIVVPDPAASRHHCTIHVEGGALSLTDEGSANGLLVNGVRVGRCALAHGDLVRVGNTDLRVVLSEVPSDEPPTRIPAERSAPRVSELDATLPPVHLLPPPASRTGMWLVVVALGAALLLAAVALGVSLAVLDHLLG